MDGLIKEHKIFKYLNQNNTIKFMFQNVILEQYGLVAYLRQIDIC